MISQLNKQFETLISDSYCDYEVFTIIDLDSICDIPEFVRFFLSFQNHA